ncbi:hypothetical protein H0S57_02980 [Acinetobacter johnsonii]|uniref:hypothetical protein n=1 Tax=Acinetobacter johnsonii TaxID=40214 RepID=UPI0018A03A08|nr:hypothetical protein [Acinetobacter johnsonii]QPF35607.1 hypothetical protein H0S57_02980 [Acinetobacter johnsonii]
MPNLEAQAAWVPVREIGIELARGGPNGNMNEQAKALLARTEYLNQEKASKFEIIQGVYEFETYSEFNAAKASLPANCTVVIGEENTTGTGTWGFGNNRWNGTSLIQSTVNPIAQVNTAVIGPIPQRQVAYEKIKHVMTNPLAFSTLTQAEYQVLDFIKTIDIAGSNTLDFTFVIVYTGGVLTDLRITDGVYSLDLLNASASVSIVSDNGKQRRIRFEHYASSHKGAVYGEIELDYSTKEYSSFIYNISEANKNLKFKAKPVISQVKHDGIFNLNANAKGTLLSNSVYTRITVDEPFILGSVSVDVIQLPTDQPAWVECTIYPQDDGFGTAQRISSTDQVPIEKLGTLRMPLENKVVQPGTYTIGFKTNVPQCLAVANGQFWRDYDAAGRPMPLNAPNLLGADKYGFFPAFSVHQHRSVLKPKLGANWSLDYRPEYFFLCGGGENLYYMHRSGMSGSREIWFGMSEDGGKTITKIGNNAEDSYIAPFTDLASTACIRWLGTTFEMYIAQSGGTVSKISIPESGVVTAIDITPPNASQTGLDSYATPVIWKGFLWWGEYGNPEAPKIHKMDLDTGTWYVSIEKPLSGVTGARHVHYLYPSPNDPNVLWANWGDATNGGGQGVNKLTITDAKASTSSDAWVQFSTGRHDDVGTTLPYPTAIMELYEPANGKLGSNEVVMIGAGDQPPVHLTVMQTKAELTGKALFKPLNFKRESAPNTETCHWLAMDEDKTIYYLVAESSPHMSLYASPYPYTDTFQISKYWQQATAGNIYYAKGYIQTRYFRFPKIKFVNALDREVSKVPFVGNATEGSLLTQFNKLIENLQGAGILQTSSEQGNDKNQSSWVDEDGQWENFG